MTEQDRDEFVRAIGEAQAAALFMGAAIVTALVEARAVDPERVAVHAQMFAQSGPGASEGVAPLLHGFAGLIRSMATMPEGAGRG